MVVTPPGNFYLAIVRQPTSVTAAAVVPAAAIASAVAEEQEQDDDPDPGLGIAAEKSARCEASNYHNEHEK